MKLFSTFIREGLDNGDKIEYDHPDEESETVRARLKEYGINVEKYEKKGALEIESVSSFFMANGKLDLEKAVVKGLNGWAEAKRKGYKHVRSIEDLGDFSSIDGQWQKWIREFWSDPNWSDPNISDWVTSSEPVGVVYDSFLMEITAINVEHMTPNQVNEMLRVFGKGKVVPARLIDVLEDTGLFSESIGLDHERLVGRKILLEIDPVSDYEKVVEKLANESMANMEHLLIFTSGNSSIHTHLAKQPMTKLFLTSLSTSTPQSVSEKEMFLPAKSTSLILDTLSKALESCTGADICIGNVCRTDANVCIVFDVLSELLSTVGRERTFTFLRQALVMLSSEKTTSFFLLNTGAHDAEVVSQLRNLFSNQLAYNKNGMEVVKTS